MAAYLTTENKFAKIQFFDKSICVNGDFFFIGSSPRGGETRMEKEITEIVKAAFEAGQQEQRNLVKKALGL